jgi:cell division protein FtsQ
MIATAPRRRRRLRLPRICVRNLALLAGAILVLGCGWLWFRDSSLVAVRQVRVTGLTGPDVRAIRQALVAAAKRMTTLDVNVTQLENAVASYPEVRSLAISTSFPHGIVIEAREEVPVATIDVGARTAVVDADGALIGHSPISVGPLPTIPLRASPAGDRLTTPGSIAALQTLAAAPYALLTHIANATQTAAHGVVVQLRNGPQIYFGSTSQLGLKWQAVIDVLNNDDAAGAAYIDVTDPHSPAAGASPG